MNGLYLSVHEDFHKANELLRVLGRSSKMKRTIIKEENILVQHKDKWISAKSLEWNQDPCEGLL